MSEFKIPPISPDMTAAPVSDQQAETTAFLAATAAKPFTEAFDETRKNYEMLIKAGEQERIRTAMSTQRILSQTEANVSLFNEAAVVGDKELMRASVDLQLSVEADDQKAALEEMAVEQIVSMAATNPDQAYLFAGALEDGNTFAQIEDFGKKMAWYQTRLDHYATKAASRGIPRKVWDLMSYFIPLNWTTAETGNVGEEQQFSSFLDHAKRIEQEGTHLFAGGTFGQEWRDGLDKNIESMLSSSGYAGENLGQLEATLQNYITSQSEGSFSNQVDIFNVRNLFTLLDATGTPTILKMLYKLGKGGAGAILTSTMAKQIHTEVAASVVESTGKGLSKSQAIHSLLPSSQKSSIELINDQGSAAINVVLARNASLQRVGKQFIDSLTSASTDDIENIITQTTKTSTFGSRIFDMAAQAGEKYATAWVGKVDGTAFQTAKVAEATAKKNKWINYVVEEAKDGSGYVVKFEKHPVDASGTIAAAKIEEVGRGSLVRSMLLSLNRVTPERLIQSIQHSQFTHQALAKQVMKPMIKTIQKLSREEGKRLNLVMEDGLQNNKWFDINELKAKYNEINGKAISDNEVLAYYTSKDINDFEWIVRNNSYRLEKDAQGWKFLRSDKLEEPVLGKKVEGTAERVINFETGEVHTGPAPHGMKIVKLEETLFRKGKEPLNHILVKDDTFELLALPGKLLSYNGGGHRIYAGKFFVKQTRTGYIQGVGEYIRNPLTHIVAESKKDAEVWATQMNTALDILAAFKDKVLSRTAASRQIKELDSIHIKNVGQMEKMIAEGKMNTQKFEVVFDRELPASTKALKGVARSDFTDGSDGISDLYRTQGKLYYSKRGEHLRNPQDELAPTINMFAATSEALNNAMRNGALTNYRIEALESWYKAALPELDRKYTNSVDAFLHGKLNGKTTEANQLNTLRDVIKRQIETQTTEGKWMDDVKNSLKKWVYDKDFKGKDAALWVLEKDPIKAMRGVAFDTKLGFFDPSQMIIQTQTMFAALALSPKFGAQAMSSLPAIKIALMNQSDEMLNYLSKNWKGLGMEPEEFKTMVKELRSSGIMDVGGEVAFINTFGESITHNFSKHVKEMRDMSRVIFFQAEQFNRITAYGIAWRELKVLNPTMDMTSKAAKRILAKRTDDYSMNMTTASSAKWQKGITSMAAQFKSYQFRLMENMVVGDFTVAQKIRLAMSQLAMYGTAGLPAADWVLEHVYGQDADEIKGVLQTGGWDQLVWGHIVGGETNFADRVGIGAGFSQIIREATEKPIAEFAFGAPGSIVGDITNSILDLHYYFATEGLNATYITEQVAMDLTKHISSLSRGYRALIAARDGDIVDSKGQTITDAPSRGYIAAALGIPIKEVEDTYELQTRIRLEKDSIREAYDFALKLRLQSFRNPEDMRRNAAVIRTVLGALPVGERVEVIKRLNKSSQFKKGREEYTLQLNKIIGMKLGVDE